jgi:hypothetical protein
MLKRNGAKTTKRPDTKFFRINNPGQPQVTELMKQLIYYSHYFGDSSDRFRQLRIEMIKLPGLSHMNMGYLAGVLAILEQAGPGQSFVQLLDMIFKTNFPPLLVVRERLASETGKAEGDYEVKRLEVIMTYINVVLSYRSVDHEVDSYYDEVEDGDEGEEAEDLEEGPENRQPDAPIGAEEEDEGEGEGGGDGGDDE